MTTAGVLLGFLSMVHGQGISCTVSAVAGTTYGNDFTGDGGKATSGTLSIPTSAWLTTTGEDLWIADYGNYRVRSVNTVSEIISTAVGNGQVPSAKVDKYYTAGNGELYSSPEVAILPYSFCGDTTGVIYIVESPTYNRVRMVGADGIVSTFFGNNEGKNAGGDGGQATVATIGRPAQCSVDPEGNVYVVALNDNQIRKVNIAKCCPSSLFFFVTRVLFCRHLLRRLRSFS